jgi:hypothetical protein
MTTHSSLAQLEIALRATRAFAELGKSHAHRAKREDSLGFLIGRDAILADWTREEAGVVTITHDFGDMIAFDVHQGSNKWQGHRWVTREDGRILTETVVENRPHARVAPPAHPPLGELRAGQGQFAATDTPILPDDFCLQAVPLVTLLHQAWNGRALNLYNNAWLNSILTRLPDATFYFERALVQGDQIAILWRVHGHHQNGQRIRLIGSSVMTWQNDNILDEATCVDFAAMVAQVSRELISYDD